MSVASLVMGCGGEVNYNPANAPDGTPPTVNLLVTRSGQPDLEVQGQPGVMPKKSTNFGNPAPNAESDFSVLATAKDPESGIRDMKIVMMRTVCFTASNGNIASAPFKTLCRVRAWPRRGGWRRQTSLA